MKRLLPGLLILISITLLAQEKLVSDTTAVNSIDGIVKEVLKIISGADGKTRDWQAFRNLFLPTATFTILNNDSTFPEPVETISLEDFISLMHDEYYQQGFIEYETGKVVDEYNGISHVFQSFYAKDSENVEGRGVTSYQLVFYDNRWWIVNIMWTGDSNGVDVPEKYLEKN